MSMAGHFLNSAKNKNKNKNKKKDTKNKTTTTTKKPSADRGKPVR